VVGLFDYDNDNDNDNDSVPGISVTTSVLIALGAQRRLDISLAAPHNG